MLSKSKFLSPVAIAVASLMMAGCSTLQSAYDATSGTIKSAYEKTVSTVSDWVSSDEPKK